MGSLLHLIQVGGSAMYVLVIVAWFAVTIFVYRLWKLRSALVLPPDNGERWFALAREGELRALREGASTDTAAGRIARAAAEEIIENEGACDESALRQAIEDAGRREHANLERYNGALSTVATVSPLLGLLGTVFGLIAMFQGISDVSGSIQRISVDQLANGIWMALLTTATGLVVAIPFA